MPPFYEIKYPSSRRFTFDVGKIGCGKHHVKALLEVDVTEARSKIAQNRRSGNKTSITAWMIRVVAECAALHPPISGINRPRRNAVAVFREVDISLVIEKDVNGARVPLPYVVRKADQKSPFQIYAEIESAKSQAFEDEGDYVLGKRYHPMWMRLFVGLPQWLRVAVMRAFILNAPQRMQDMMGTVMITTVGMMNHAKGWIIPFSMHPLCLALGSLNEQPAVYKGEIQKREILHVTVLIDHDAIDGVPSARFVDELVEKLESGSGL